MDAEQRFALQKIAREAYDKVRVVHPHMPAADSAEGQRKIDRLLDIISKPFHPQEVPDGLRALAAPAPEADQ